MTLLEDPEVPVLQASDEIFYEASEDDMDGHFSSDFVEATDEESCNITSANDWHPLTSSDFDLECPLTSNSANSSLKPDDHVTSATEWCPLTLNPENSSMKPDDLEDKNGSSENMQHNQPLVSANVSGTSIVNMIPVEVKNQLTLNQMPENEVEEQKKRKTSKSENRVSKFWFWCCKCCNKTKSSK